MGRVLFLSYKLVVVLLICGLPLVHGKRKQHTDCGIENNTNRPGADMNDGREEHVNEPCDCYELCDQTVGCKAWVFRKDTFQCWLKRSVTSDKQDLNSVSGVMKDACEKEDHVDRPGGDMKNGKSTVESRCRCYDQCDEKSDCKAWVFHKQTKECWLKDKVTDAKYNKMSVSGVMKECDEQNNTDLPGGDMSNGKLYQVSSPCNCSALCANTSGCKAWTYDKKTYVCWMKNETRNAKYNVDGVSGIMRQGCQMQDEINLSGGDMENEDAKTVDDYTDCCDSCKKTEGCEAWSYNKDTKRCRLKDKTPTKKTSHTYISGYMGHGCDMEDGVDRPGGDIDSDGKNSTQPNVTECCYSCKNNADCKGWSYNWDTMACSLKSKLSDKKADKKYVSGVISS